MVSPWTSHGPLVMAGGVGRLASGRLLWPLGGVAPLVYVGFGSIVSPQIWEGPPVWD